MKNDTDSTLLPTAVAVNLIFPSPPIIDDSSETDMEREGSEGNV